MINSSTCDRFANRGITSVDDFSRELIILNDLVKQFPDGPVNAEGIGDNEMVRLLYHVIPEAWQDVSAGYRYYSSTMEEVYDYMEAQEESQCQQGQVFSPGQQVCQV